ncbi:hypothetical protein SAMN05444274_10995 [Mariniphaga anaerophila]|uniref:Uncharacterized protein n=1 Tax=Mariniphaga anaerophila TaxID=1484053 RepID=A0A1M5EMR9_9BACT|nr:hypothetical protein SAMN05444274_10995 [Mariniphaga anaerophila]
MRTLIWEGKAWKAEKIGTEYFMKSVKVELETVK